MIKSQVKPLLESRKAVQDLSVMWDQLSLAQKFSVSSLGKFGYELIFIRISENGKIAILQCNDGLAVISADGDIDTSPDVTIRQFCVDNIA